jgi:hypothetical protein
VNLYPELGQLLGEGEYEDSYASSVIRWIMVTDLKATHADRHPPELEGIRIPATRFQGKYNAK